jgi:hypothetical protein
MLEVFPDNPMLLPHGIRLLTKGSSNAASTPSLFGHNTNKPRLRPVTHEIERKDFPRKTDQSRPHTTNNVSKGRLTPLAHRLNNLSYSSESSYQNSQSLGSLHSGNCRLQNSSESTPSLRERQRSGQVHVHIPKFLIDSCFI